MTAETGSQASRIVHVMRSGGENSPLFLVHGIDGTVRNLEAMTRYLPHDRPIYGIESPPLDSNTPPPASVEEMSERYLQIVRNLQPAGPYFLFGYSLGGIIAFDLAQRLTATGERVALLAMLDSPQLEYARRRSRSLWGRTRQIAGIVALHLNKLIAGPDRFEYLRDRFRSRAASLLLSRNASSDRSLIKKLASLHNVNFVAVNRYVPQRYRGSIVLLRAAGLDNKNFDYVLGWGGLAAGGIEVIDLPGRHDTMTQEPNVRVLAERLQGCLQKADILERFADTQAK